MLVGSSRPQSVLTLLGWLNCDSFSVFYTAMSKDLRFASIVYLLRCLQYSLPLKLDPATNTFSAKAWLPVSMHMHMHHVQQPRKDVDCQISIPAPCCLCQHAPVHVSGAEPADIVATVLIVWHVDVSTSARFPCTEEIGC